MSKEILICPTSFIRTLFCVHEQKYIVFYVKYLLNFHKVLCDLCMMCVLFCSVLKLFFIFHFFILVFNFLTSAYCALCYDRKKKNYYGL